MTFKQLTELVAALEGANTHPLTIVKFGNRESNLTLSPVYEMSGGSLVLQTELIHPVTFDMEERE